ncbi:uncharacterized protein LOC129277354 [Lytechinus pictus]|uniref:uncharacterized protein LOC129277354 n=1 Tax=Lytechinus pictus TaxID=7653 RepID=UPI00240D2025|nr:uncharacterized protein LOC129277354 [Lytechinus pictus]
MYRHHEHQNTGQEQYTTSINTSSERCIPIKRRLLDKFYSSIQTASTQPNERNLVAHADLSRHSVDQVGQSEALDLRKAKKSRICTSPDFKQESAALPGKTRPQLQSKKPVLEQCLRGVDYHIARPALQKVLQYHDHYKLSIGERTKLDKMLDDELLAKYFESERTYSPGRAESPGRRPQGSMLSTLSYDREPHWDGHNSLGLRVSNKSSRTNAFGHSCGTTLTRQHQPREVPNEVSSIMLKDLAGMGNGLSTISVTDLWAPAVTSESCTSENHISSLATSQSDELQQLRINGIATNEFLPRTALKQPKRERDLAVQFCQRTQSHCSVSSEELRMVEVEKRRNEITNIVVKSEADTCSVIGNEQTMTPATKNEIDQEATAIVKTPADGKCPICSDVVSGYHYGTRSCESCKGFFKRTIQNKRNERLACAVAGNCVINLQNRKHCAYCRYKKCLEAGMKNEGECIFYMYVLFSFDRLSKQLGPSQ